MLKSGSLPSVAYLDGKISQTQTIQDIEQDITDVSSDVEEKLTDLRKDWLVSTARSAISSQLEPGFFTNGRDDAFKTNTAGAGSTGQWYDISGDHYSNAVANFTTVQTGTFVDGPSGIYIPASYSAAGNSFTLTGAATVKQVQFLWKRSASTSTNVYGCRIYAATGTVGIDALPTGEVLATSSTQFTQSTLSTSDTLATFVFNNLLPIGGYCAEIFVVSGSSSNGVTVEFGELQSTTNTNGFYKTTGGVYVDYGAAAATRFAVVVDATNALELHSFTYTAAAEPTDMVSVWAVQDMLGGLDFETDLTVECSIDGGTTWTAAAVTDLGECLDTTGVHLLICEADVTAQTGTSCICRIKCAVTKSVRVHYCAQFTEVF